jgi:alpha-L-rhamnosidase
MDPWRERGQWWGDSYLIDQINKVAFGDASLLHRGLLFMENAFAETGAPGCAPHNNNMHMLDYAMLWVHSLADYARRTGDLGLLADTYPTLQQFIQHLNGYTNPETGLLDLPKISWAETAYIDTLGYSSRYGQSAALNAMYSATLQNAAEIALQLGDTANHELWLARAAAVKNSLNSLLYLPDQGRYLTNIYDGTAYPPTLYAQAWPLAYGIVPEADQERVASALLELLSTDPAAPNVGTYGFYWVLKGLGQAGHIDQALTITKSYYGRMIDRGATTWWENFLADQSYSNALSHGWGSAPTWFITTYVLGIAQTAPDEWRFQPTFGSPVSASGAIPLGQGVLQASWQTDGCTSGALSGTIHIQVSAPPGTHGQLILPHADMQWVNINGSHILPANLEAIQDSDQVIIPLGSGQQIIEIGTACAELP